MRRLPSHPETVGRDRVVAKKTPETETARLHFVAAATIKYSSKVVEVSRILQ